MEDEKTGGPAFPSTIKKSPARIQQEAMGGPGIPTEVHVSGMTLRDYFAAKAMQAYIIGSADSDAIWTEETQRDACQLAHEFSDMMLIVRGQTKGDGDWPARQSGEGSRKYIADMVIKAAKESPQFLTIEQLTEVVQGIVIAMLEARK